MRESGENENMVSQNEGRNVRPEMLDHTYVRLNEEDERYTRVSKIFKNTEDEISLNKYIDSVSEMKVSDLRE